MGTDRLTLIYPDITPLRMHLLAHAAGMTVTELEALPYAVIAALDRGVNHGMDIGETIGHVNAALRWKRRLVGVIVAGAITTITAFGLGAGYAAPRSSPVIPSESARPASAGASAGASTSASSSDQATSGAPQPTVKDSGLPDASTGLATSPAVPSGAPAQRLGDWSCSDPPLCGEPAPTVRPAPAIAHGSAYGEPLTGRASYYGTGGPGMYAALPGRWVRNRTVKVCGKAACMVVRIVTTCGCHTNERSAKIIDLSVPLFEYVTGYSPAERRTYGVATVTITVYAP